MKGLKSFRWFMVVAAVALVPTLKADWDDILNPGIVPPNQKVQGLTYEQWNAKWWQFVLGIPADNNPLTAGLNYDCKVGQSGNVWFLTGIWGQSPIVATRRCTVPKATYLFFPIANETVVNSFVGPSGLDWTDDSTDDLRKQAKDAMDAVIDMSCKIDNRYVHHLESVRGSIYRVTSPVFHPWLPPNNVAGIPVYTPPGKVAIPGTVADGVYLMLEPLPPGAHTIEFTASFGTAPDALRFDITYIIEVPK